MRSSLPEPDTPDFIAATAALGLDFCQAGVMHELDPALDRSRLRELRQEVQGVRIGTGLGMLNPAREERLGPLVAAGDGDLTDGVIRVVDVASAGGFDRLFFMIGTLEDRFSGDPEWSAQLDGCASLIERLAPVLRAKGVRLLLKTHEEITSREIVRLVERVGEDVLGVAFDPVNLLVRGEDPLAAARRLAPLVEQVHLDDAVMVFEGRGLRRYLSNMGQGVIDWTGILDVMPDVLRVIDLHGGQFAVDLFDPEFVVSDPDLTVGDLATVTAMAARQEANATIPDQARTLARLAAALAHPAMANKDLTNNREQGVSI